VLVSGYAGGLDSLGAARRTIRRGQPAVLAGGTEGPIAPYALAAQITSGRMTTSRDPRTGYQPFDANAGGYVTGEGGAILMVEDADAAAERAAPHVYGEIAGYAATHDGYHHADPAPDSRQLARAMRRALADAGVRPDEIGFIVADGAGTPALDALEAAAIADVFGERTAHVPVTAPHGLLGRLGAGSAVNVVTALLALRDGVIPAVGNLIRPGDYGLDLVREPRAHRAGAVLVNARGYGGFNSSIVLKRLPEERQ
jgi:minimal PKS chain-length factor (CLF/KS beta)